MQRYPVYQTGKSTTAEEIVCRHIANARQEIKARMNIDNFATLEEITDTAFRNALSGTVPHAQENGDA